MSKRLIVAAVAILFSGLTACKRTDKASTGEAVKSADVMRQEVTALEDSIDLHWNKMIRSDDEKIDYLSLLLTELDYAGAYDKRQIAELNQMQKSLKSKRFVKEDMGNHERILSYDNATDSLLYKVRLVAYSSTIKEKFPRIDLLLEDIKVKDDSIIFYRADYDKRVKAYNQYLQDNKKPLSKVDPAYANAAPKPLFQLGVSQ
jgi:hypothetical protein